MASPPPHSAPATVVIGYPVPHPPPRGHHRPHPRQQHTPLCDLRPKCSMSDLCFALPFVAICLIPVVLCFFVRLQIGAEYPMLEVTALTVSNLTVAASTGATWKAALLAGRSATYGSSSFREVECFVYYHWDMAQPLAVGSVAPFVLQGASRTVIEVSMTMDRPEAAAVVRDMDREWRSVGTVVVGLGLRMRGTYVCASWWKKQYGRIEARCDNLRIAFANSTTEGSLVISDHIIISSQSPPSPSDNLPSCSYDD